MNTSKAIAHPLAQAVARLQSGDPEGWKRFMAILAERVEEKTEQCISSPLDTLAQAQGRAQEARDFARELAGAIKLAQQLHDIERANGPVQRKP